MIDPYLAGSLVRFSYEQDENGIFSVRDTFCSIQQLYHINQLYRNSLTSTDLVLSLQSTDTSKIVYSANGNSFKCVYGMYFRGMSFIPYESYADNLKYVTGFVDMNAVLKLENDQPVLTIHTYVEEWLQVLKSFINIPCAVHDKRLEYRSTNVIDLFGTLEEGAKKKQLQQLLQDSPFPLCKVIRKDPDAVFPYKARLSDVGYDLTIIKKHKDLTSNTSLYDTGIALDMPFKYYVEIVPRSSLAKSGYMLSNNVGIIDPGYKGNLYIALTKVSPEVLDIVFPFRCCQLIFKKQVYVNLVESVESEESTRGEGGYGSTG